MSQPTATTNFQDLLALMARLRTNCPWDAKQTNQSLQKYAIEEVFELIEAIGADDGTPRTADDIKGELGDVLLQVVFHAHLYAEQQRFDMGDVIYALQDKLIRRHPHVFDKENLTTDAAVKARWDEIKRLENEGKPVRKLSDVKAGTALNQAQNLQASAASVGFDWANLQGVLNKLQEEIAELKAVLPSGEFDYKNDKLDGVQKQQITDELGDCLFVLTNLARHTGVDSEMALQGTIAKFKRRFAHVEDSLQKAGKDFSECDLAMMDRYWDEAKTLEK
ncbi:nucleoside triphosphate pyrophosphohydrolase [Moraxella caviae]|uniref:Nucleoside triphosphate pyrophosphohydrolase n=1 Tax=Moraxella caviae TaxID=34060 RepID=A0A1S9ZW87_9GAMM|nr:nucleoside triphosphate pyrophosphohydrolase [Moraxella caviae]OOR87806.1 nucleoside triphosphate pyrophosphohydrolase [Moraxella caviae]STZ10560.1 Nucleoside triphosphate pyrophosphohydrolase [Moraxella caviae]VEW12968.1 Nucleoside triphosphate pyrophosphohydrolase [Moraxella caviae]